MFVLRTTEFLVILVSDQVIGSGLKPEPSWLSDQVIGSGLKPEPVP